MELQKIMKEAIDRGCSVVTSLFAKRILIATEEGIAIATENDYIEFCLDELYGLQREISMVVMDCLERYKGISAQKKNELAKRCGISYGKLQEMVHTLELETQEAGK